VSVRARKNTRGVRARVTGLIAVIALLPVLTACSSSSSVEYATDAYPSQSLVDLLKASRNSPGPAPSAEAPPPVAAGAAPLVPTSAPAPAREPPIAATAAATPPPPAAAPPPAETDPVAAAYPSVSLIDLLTGARKPAQ
jgi:hypothetical protein